MFLNPIWSLLLLLVGCGALYFFIIRPRLRTHFVELYSEIDSVWARLWFIATKFKKTMVAIGAILITAAPDLLVQIAPLDFSLILPKHLAVWTGPICTAIVTLLAARDKMKAAG